jgi:hypothetical protein
MIASWALLVEHARDSVFADAGLAADEDGDVASNESRDALLETLGGVDHVGSVIMRRDRLGRMRARTFSVRGCVSARDGRAWRVTFAPVRTWWLLVLVALALTGCTNPKTEQCNKLIERANLSQAVLKGITFTSLGKEELEESAKKIDNEVDWVKHSEVSDPTIVKYRDDYAGNLAKIAAALRELAKLNGNVQSESGKKIIEGASKVEEAQSQLVGDINSYCRAR